jgi:hypothetical protein
MTLQMNEIDLTYVPWQEGGMILALQGIARRGPTQEDENEGYVELTSPADVERHVGLEAAAYPVVNHILYYLASGAKVLFSRVVAAGAVKATRTFNTGGGTPTLRITATSPGVWGNLVTVTIAADPSGSASLFKLTVAFSEQPALNQTYFNLSMDPTKANFVENVLNGVDPLITADALTTSRPANAGPLALTGGAASDAVAAADYLSRQTLFDPEDFITHMAQDDDDGEIWYNQAAYAQTRATILQIQGAPFGLTPAQAVMYRQGSGGYGYQFVDNSYTTLGWGDVKTKRKGSAMPVAEWVQPLLIGLYARKMATTKPWLAVAGNKRGIVPNAFGVATNVYNKPAQTTLTDNEVNPAIVAYDPDLRKKVTKFAESLTCQRARSQRRFTEIRELCNYVKRRFSYHRQAIEFDPNEPSAWRELYGRMKKDLDAIGTEDPKGFDGPEGIGYQYQGDQHAVRRQDATYNKQPDLANGEYKVRLFIVGIPGIRKLTFDVVLTQTSAQFAETEE